MLLYVDDIILTTSSRTLKNELIQKLAQEFKMTGFSPLHTALAFMLHTLEIKCSLINTNTQKK